MAIDQKKRQKKLAKKKSKRKMIVSSKKKKLSFSEILPQGKAIMIAKDSPVTDALIRKDIFSEGIGTAILARKMPSGYIGAGLYLLDVWCLGVKNSYFTVLTEEEYADRIRNIEIHEELENIHPSCLRKLIDECVEFSAELGFSPHKGYKISRKLLLDIDPTVCPNQYAFGKDGKPFYISGPNETEQQARMTVNNLMRKCGEGNFDYIVSVGNIESD